jgi:hypothetical protein
MSENPARSPAAIVQQSDYPATRDELVETAEDSESPAEVINFLKCLPRERYESAEEVMRDFAEAERVFGNGGNRMGPVRDNLNLDNPHP